MLEVDNTRVRDAQIRLLREIREKRDETNTQLTLGKLTDAARSGDGNLLRLSIEASRQRATVGEISGALEKGLGAGITRWRGLPRVSIAAAHDNGEDYRRVVDEIKVFTEFEGRAPSILVVKMGQDGHDRGAKVIANAFADLGFKVGAGELFQTPGEAAIDVRDRDVHVGWRLDVGGGPQDPGAAANPGTPGARLGRCDRRLRRCDSPPGPCFSERSRRGRDLRPPAPTFPKRRAIF